MDTAPAFRSADLEIELHEQRRLIERQMVQIDRQQVILDVQFRRIADIQAELDREGRDAACRADVRRRAEWSATSSCGWRFVASGLIASSRNGN